jgi:hypothetical protein
MIVAYLEIFMQRYSKCFGIYWHLGSMSHVIMGYFISGTTLYWGFKALANIGWSVESAGSFLGVIPSPHTILGLIMISLMIVV